MSIIRRPRILTQSWESQGFGGNAQQRQPPAMQGIVHWYDFSDLTTTWQDEASTIQAVSHEDEIVTITDKGYGGDKLYSGAATDPEVDLTTHIRPSALFLNQTLNADTAVNGGIEKGLLAPWSVMVIAATEQTGTTQYITYWDGIAWNSMLLTAGDVIQGHGAESTGTVTGDTVFAAISNWTDSDNEVTYYYNLDAGSIDETNPDPVIADNATMRIGATTAAASVEDFGGNIMEIIWWDHSLSAGEIDLAQQYAATKWGVTWA